MIRPAWQRLVAAGLWLGLATGASASETPAVVYNGGLLSIRCANAPLAGVLEQVKAATGMELIFEGTPAATRLTADIPSQPVSLALPRLLEGTGVNYLLVADQADPRRVAKMYVGSTAAASGATPSSPLADRRAARSSRPAPAVNEPMALPVPEVPAEEPAGDDEEVSTNVPTSPDVEPVAPTGPDVHPMRDPFGRPIPRNNPGGADGGRRGEKRDQ